MRIRNPLLLVPALLVASLLASGCAADPRTRVYQEKQVYRTALHDLNTLADAGRIDKPTAVTLLKIIPLADSVLGIAQVQAEKGDGPATDRALDELTRYVDQLVSAGAKSRAAKAATGGK